MKISEFMNEENHISNLDNDMFNIFDLKAITDLPYTEDARERVYWLSQWLVGNVSEPFEDIKKLDKAEQWRVFDTWLDIIKDPDTLRQISKSIIRDFVKGDAL